MVTLTINRKPQGIFSKSPATPLQNKTDTAYKMKAGDQIPQLNDKQKPADKTPWRHDKTPEQKTVSALFVLWNSGLSHSTGKKKQNHLKWGYLTT